MNVFDFDKTIYPRDSAAEFIVYIALRHPGVIADLIRGLPTVVAYKRGRVSKTAMKERLFTCFARVPDIDLAVSRFWDKRIGRIGEWYLKIKRPDDVVISASPEFLIAEACKRLEISAPIASRVDKKTGRYSGENCYGEEKPRRFAALFSVDDIDEFYSDSYSDAPMARLAKKAYLVNGNRLREWEKEKM